MVSVAVAVAPFYELVALAASERGAGDLLLWGALAMLWAGLVLLLFWFLARRAVPSWRIGLVYGGIMVGSGLVGLVAASYTLPGWFGLLFMVALFATVGATIPYMRAAQDVDTSRSAAQPRDASQTSEQRSFRRRQLRLMAVGFAFLTVLSFAVKLGSDVHLADLFGASGPGEDSRAEGKHVYLALGDQTQTVRSAANPLAGLPVAGASTLTTQPSPSPEHTSRITLRVLQGDARITAVEAERAGQWQRLTMENADGNLTVTEPLSEANVRVTVEAPAHATAQDVEVSLAFAAGVDQICTQLGDRPETCQTTRMDA